MAKGDDRAVVGASGKLDKEMKLESGTKDVAKSIGYSDAPSRNSKGQFEKIRRGVKFRLR